MPFAEPHVRMQRFGVKSVAVCPALGIKHQFAKPVRGHEIIFTVFENGSFEQIACKYRTLSERRPEAGFR